MNEQADTQAAVIAKVREVEALARQKFARYTAPALAVTFFKAGKSAGLAYIGDRHEVAFNLSVMAQGDYTTRNTVAHEVAHIVAFALYGDTGHGRYWKMVVVMLGGSASRTCNARAQGITVQRARRTRAFRYLDSLGREVWMSSPRHTRLMAGKATYSVEKDGVMAKITPSGYTGQSKLFG